MISVEQIRMLESKVQRAVGLLSSLQEENSVLKSKLSTYEKRIDELEFLIEEFKEDQSEIEQGILSALNKLDGLESAAKQVQDALFTTKPSPNDDSANEAPAQPPSPSVEESETPNASDEAPGDTEDDESVSIDLDEATDDTESETADENDLNLDIF